MKAFLVVLTAIEMFSGTVKAGAITYTETVIGTGTLGATPFTNALVTLTFIANTANIINSSPGIFQDTVGTGLISVAGVGNGTFTDQVEAVVNQGIPGAGLSDFTENLLMLWTNASVFATYNLASAIGPISSTAQINSVGFSYATSLGNLSFASTSGNSTFTATTTPEPATEMLLSAGLLGLAILRRSVR